MKRFSVNGSITAHEGKGKELQGYLLQAAEGMEEIENCYCYIVGVNEEETDKVYIYEVWENEAAHQASLKLDVFLQLTNQAKLSQ